MPINITKAIPVRKRKKTEYVCGLCGWVGPSKMYRRGNRYEEVYLWAACLPFTYVFFPALLIPIIYSIYRYRTKYEACEACRCRKLVPARSTEGREIIQNFENQCASIKAACSIQNSYEKADV